MFLPNTTCWLHRRSGAPNRRGEYDYAPRVITPCSVVKLNLKTDHTSVRADSSASRGKAEEEQGDARLLFPANTVIAAGDIVEVEGEGIRATEIFPRRNVLGVLDHLDVSFEKSQLP